MTYLLRSVPRKTSRHFENPSQRYALQVDDEPRQSHQASLSASGDSLSPRIPTDSLVMKTVRPIGIQAKEWARQDSNLGPQPYQATLGTIVYWHFLRGLKQFSANSPLLQSLGLRCVFSQ
jgi:hypothetical protein